MFTQSFVPLALSCALSLAACAPASTMRTLPAPAGAFPLVSASCSFEGGWVSVLPAAVYDRKQPYLMQALIGIVEDPGFWEKQPEYKSLAPYAAKRCDGPGASFRVPAGDYVFVAGWANRFKVHGAYKNNGFVQPFAIGATGSRSFRLTPELMTHTWSCISCPHLQVWRAGRFVEAGQVLVDRYSPVQRGTDLRAVSIDVEGGLVRLRLVEREPEISFIDAFSVRIGERTLTPLGLPNALRAIDREVVRLVTGDVVELTFRAEGLPDGRYTAHVSVSGHYEPLVHL
jgi:hypothetical protein